MVDYEALHDALASGHLRGAMLETFWQEPPPRRRAAAQARQCHADPAHRRRFPQDGEAMRPRLVADEVGRYLRGEPFVNPC